jgi:hypothetical protein
VIAARLIGQHADTAADATEPLGVAIAAVIVVTLHVEAQADAEVAATLSRRADAIAVGARLVDQDAGAEESEALGEALRGVTIRAFAIDQHAGSEYPAALRRLPRIRGVVGVVAGQIDAHRERSIGHAAGPCGAGVKVFASQIDERQDAVFGMRVAPGAAHDHPAERCALREMQVAARGAFLRAGAVPPVAQAAPRILRRLRRLHGGVGGGGLVDLARHIVDLGIVGERLALRGAELAQATARSDGRRRHVAQRQDLPARSIDETVDEPRQDRLQARRHRVDALLHVLTPVMRRGLAEAARLERFAGLRVGVLQAREQRSSRRRVGKVDAVVAETADALVDGEEVEELVQGLRLRVEGAGDEERLRGVAHRPA